MPRKVFMNSLNNYNETETGVDVCHKSMKFNSCNELQHVVCHEAGAKQIFNVKCVLSCEDS